MDQADAGHVNQKRGACDKVPLVMTKEDGYMKEYISKDQLVTILEEKKAKWDSLKGKEQDVSHENFICDIILSIDWLISDINRIEFSN